VIQASCCCGAVRFSLSREPRFVAICHCSRCRKLGATPFAMVDADSFELQAGAEHVTHYEPEPPFKYRRSFCGRCGTSLGELGSGGDMFPVSVDCFDTPVDLEIRFHEHVATRPSWFVIPEGVKQFEGNPG
jgi:hypothetical protein